MDRLIGEIEGCIEHGYYFAALSLALTIPDVCASFGKGRKITRYDYACWCDKWVEKDLELDGAVIYSLRCSILHSMDADIEEEPMFELYKRKQAQAGECRALTYRFFFPHQDRTEPLICRSETDERVDRVPCVSMLTYALIRAYQSFAESTPAFTHEYINLWLEG